MNYRFILVSSWSWITKNVGVIINFVGRFDEWLPDVYDKFAMRDTDFSV